MTKPLVLASGSKVRAALLTGAGLRFSTEPSDVNETEIKVRLKAEGASAGAIAEALAIAKARARITAEDRFVIGADQILVLEGELFDKAATVAEAGAKLKQLKGKTHHLISAACILRGDDLVWKTTKSVSLHMREFSDAFLEDYLSRNEEAALASVGAYQLEGEGIQLFDRIEGDYFTILGLPLLEMLDVLRQNGVIAN